MSSLRKIQANRRNAQRSTGPKSQEGKTASSHNATRHGLSSDRLVVLPGESQQDLDALIQALNDEFEPATETERHYVERMIHARWKLLRAERLEAEAFEWVLEGPETLPSADRRILRDLSDPSGLINRVERYAASAERAYSKALKELLQYRAQTAKQEKQNKAKAAEDWLKTEFEKVQNEPIDAWDDPTLAPPQLMQPSCRPSPDLSPGPGPSPDNI